MSGGLRNGLIVALLHVAIVGSLGAKLLIDRASRPRAWTLTAPVDPDLPIRGRYISIRLAMPVSGGLAAPPVDGAAIPVGLAVRDGLLVATAPAADAAVYARLREVNGRQTATLERPLAYFIPEHSVDPSRRAAGEELWVEVTIPWRGMPRPIRLGVKKNGVLTPIAFD